MLAEAPRSPADFDMDVIDHTFADSAMILPHRRLSLLSGEFRKQDHSQYMASDDDVEKEDWPRSED
ncbi:N-acetylglucosaminyltransferase [Diplodia seriata]|uniref:N-acetylglucosaminyltransferase n=1 Tax=Diplodia seriata TaxID=420778 RepID=A0ABR3CDF1_9PEZI